MASKEEILDQSGRPLGVRALKKRRQLMDATAELLEKAGLRELKVVDIARFVDTSPATFYQYFKDVEDVVLELAEEATDKTPSLIQMFEGEWSGDAGLQQARAIVEAFIQYWDEHGAVLRVRNMAADEGDIRFLAMRSRGAGPLLDAMSNKVSVDNKKPGFKPLAAAAAMGAILDRLSSYHRELEGFGVSRQGLVETTAQILFDTLAG